MNIEGYHTLNAEGTSEFKILGSAFYGIAQPVINTSEIDSILSKIKNKYPNADHCPFAFRLWEGEQLREHQSDDGEPSGTAGKPLLLALQQSGVSNAIIIVVRYFGGKKLGTGRLFHAFFDCGALAIKKTQVIFKNFIEKIPLNFPYPLTHLIHRAIIEFEGEIISSHYTDQVHITVAIPKHRYGNFIKTINDISGGKALIAKATK